MIAHFESIVAASNLKLRLCERAGTVVALVNEDAVQTVPLGVGVDGETPMEAGSLTKVFTGLLTAQSILAGELGLDTRLDRLLFEEEWPGESIMVSHLATHTSGLPRLSMSRLSVLLHPKDPYRNYSRRDLLDWLQAKKPVVPDDAKFSYSNFGYAVLGLMLEKATGKTYEELLSSRLLEAFGMKHTGLHLTGRHDMTASGFDSNGSSTSVWHFDGYAPCGALVSTATDMARMVQAIVQPTDWIRNAMDVATQPLAKSLHGDVGLAWMMPRGGTWVWHNGATFGYTAYLGVNRQRRYGAAILCNQFLPAEVTELGHQLMRLSENKRGEEGV
jgi:CubicO group peptidase (beta-lactamase class C family)